MPSARTAAAASSPGTGRWLSPSRMAPSRVAPRPTAPRGRGRRPARRRCGWRRRPRPRARPRRARRRAGCGRSPPGPSISPTARKGARASGSCGSTRGGAAVGEQELARPAARLGDAVREGQGQDGAGRQRAASAARPRRGRPAAAKVRARPRAFSDFGERSRRQRSSRSAASAPGAAEAALDEQRRDLAAELRRAAPRRLHHHAGDARRRGDAGHGAPSGRDGARGVERADAREQLARLRHGGGGRRIEPAQRSRARRPPRWRGRARGRTGRRRASRAGRRAAGRRRRPRPRGGSRCPGSVRPARPRRWSAEARDTRTVSSRVSPRSGS